MRDHLLVYVNGKEHLVGDRDAFLSLAEFLRLRLGLVGTKIVCAEGDCGSCSVLVGRPHGQRFSYQVVDSCIQFMYQLDGSHIVTVEGLRQNGKLHPVQDAMVECHGSQCGYCTPGFVVAMAGLMESNRDAATGANPQLADDETGVGLSGNLCRCTGYVQILNAARSVDVASLPALAEMYPEELMRTHIARVKGSSVQIQAGAPGGRRTVYIPVDLQSAARFKTEEPDALVVSGATDIGVSVNAGLLDSTTILSLCAIEGLDAVTVDGDALDGGTLVIGARATWSQIDNFVKDLVPEYHKILRLFGSPQIRNVATIGGNLANASSIADSLPFLFVMDAEVELAGPSQTRRIKINDFYLNHKQTAMRPDELIVRIRTPLPTRDETLRLYKISRRRDLDIATLTAGILLRRDVDRIASARVACGGVGPVVTRLPQTEAFLTGKPYEEEVFREAGRRARGEISPITDVRGSAVFRLRLTENILLKFFHDTTGGTTETDAAPIALGSD